MNSQLLSQQLVVLDSGLVPFANAIEHQELFGKNGLFGDEFVSLDSSFLSLPRVRLSSSTSACDAMVLYDSEVSFTLEDPLAVQKQTYLAGVVDSTFSVAWHLHQNGFMAEWAAIIASQQVQGRGQLRRPWYSPPGNLHVSFCLPSSPLFTHQAGSLVVAYMVLEALRLCSYPVKLKWPNDFVSLAGEKIGGLLVEQRDKVQMAGLGINIVHAPQNTMLQEDFAYPASSLRILLGEQSAKISPFSLWVKVLGYCLVIYEKLRFMSVKDILTKATTHLYYLHQELEVFEDGRSLGKGFCKGLNEQGHLLLLCSDGSIWEIASGTVRLVDVTLAQ